jgi:hypothetical protein
MKYRRMNITLPADVVKRLAKIANKSAFISRAVADRFAALEKEEKRRLRLEGYRYVAAHPEYENDARDDW